jgi:hypothetical protein
MIALPCLVSAATVGDTADMNALKGRGVFSLRQTRNICVDFSFDVDAVLERDIAAGGASAARLTNSTWSMTKFGCRIFDRVEPYVKAGWAHLKAEWKDTASGAKVAMSAKSGFGWGLGVKAFVYEFQNPKIKITVDGSYRKAALDAEKGFFNDNKTSIDIDQSRFVIREWQAALLASGEIDVGAKLNQIEALREYRLCPYGGITFSEINGRLRLVDESGTVYSPRGIKSDKNFGVVIGCDLAAPGDYAAFNFEGRFISETALSAGLSMLF